MDQVMTTSRELQNKKESAQFSFMQPRNSTTRLVQLNTLRNSKQQMNTPKSNNQLTETPSPGMKQHIKNNAIDMFKMSSVQAQQQQDCQKNQTNDTYRMNKIQFEQRNQIKGTSQQVHFEENNSPSRRTNKLMNDKYTNSTQDLSLQTSRNFNSRLTSPIKSPTTLRLRSLNTLTQTSNINALTEDELVVLKQQQDYDENTKHAIEYRLSRQKHSDFYVKLDILAERIQVYKYLFLERVPKFLIKRAQEDHLSGSNQKRKQKSQVNRKVSPLRRRCGIRGNHSQTQRELNSHSPNGNLEFNSKNGNQHHHNMGHLTLSKQNSISKKDVHKDSGTSLSTRSR
eukprot:403370071